MPAHGHRRGGLASAWRRSERDGGRWVLVATAHPAKFAEIVEPLIGRPVPVPESLAAAVRAAEAEVEIEAQAGRLRGGAAGEKLTWMSCRS